MNYKRIVKRYTMSKKVDFVNSLKDLNVTDLKARIQEDELRLKKLEFAHAISPLENPMSIRALRKDVARLKTSLTQKNVKG
jgi:large subunit ribosomal protein L29